MCLIILLILLGCDHGNHVFDYQQGNASPANPLCKQDDFVEQNLRLGILFGVRLGGSLCMGLKPGLVTMLVRVRHSPVARTQANPEPAVQTGSFCGTKPPIFYTFWCPPKGSPLHGLTPGLVDPRCLPHPGFPSPLRCSVPHALQVNHPWPWPTNQ